MASTCADLSEWLDRLQKAGVVPPEVRRVIIDIGMDECVKVYYECLADKAMFSIDLVDLVSGTKAINVMDVQKRKTSKPAPKPPPPPPNEKAF